MSSYDISTLSKEEEEDTEEEERLRGIFAEFDRDGDGTIDAFELKVAIENALEAPIEAWAVEKMIAEVDRNNSSTINYEEFVHVFGKCGMKSAKDVARRWTGVGKTVGSDFSIALPTQQGEILKFFFAGALGGGAARTVTAPLDRIKVMQQTSDMKSTGSSTFEMFKQILKREGVRGLFRGNGVGLLRGSIFTGFVCGIFGNATKLLNNYIETSPQNRFYWRLVIGGIAGVIASFACYPLDVTYARLVTSSETKAVSLWRTISNLRYFRASSSGLYATLMAIAPFAAVDKAAYNYCKDKLQQHAPNIRPVFTFTIAASVAGIAATTFTHPLDTIRRRIHVSSLKKKPSVLNTVRSVLKENGPQGLFRGVSPAYLKVVPSLVISYAVLEHVLMEPKKQIS
eukprot:TRINITY_DN11070_c0_g1_i1.p1 TRINITY_DN11070_c0_g1~~TRINITY_DN11070_c0_g1_i1.p1  ORF type:complete len:417 (-),score=70.68 TRINITY_DN11070_c0_g1_i1:167-1363(-)